MTDNLDLWKLVERTDPAQTKPITGKPYKGTSPKPYFIVHEATRVFGPCGIGWGFNIVSDRVEDGAPGDRVHIVHIKVWYIHGDKRGEVEHVGQTMFCGKNKNGPYTDEDAPKKSVTDALVKALSMIGFAGDIFMGRYDDSKYVNDLREDFSEKPAQDDSTGTYLAISRKKIAEFSNAKALKTWWENDAAMRESLGIVNGTPEYHDLFKAFRERGVSLAERAAA
jgi:hypothetical protein